MTNQKPTRSPEVQPAKSGLPAIKQPETSALDAHGFNKDDYDWLPVPRQRRADGWSHERQREFIGTLADCGSVTEAAREVGMSAKSCYRLRRSPGAEGFAHAWELAIQQASRRLADIAFDRAINGTEHRVIDREGNHIYTHYRTNDRLLMFLLRAHNPGQYGFAPQRSGAYARAEVQDNGEQNGEEPVSPAAGSLVAGLPLAKAIAALGPVVPDDPFAAMHPDDRTDMIADQKAEEELQEELVKEEQRKHEENPRTAKNKPSLA